MKIRDLIQHWETTARMPKTARQYNIQLPVYAAAKVAALVEMYPGRSEEQIICDLLCSALEELNESFAYVQGDKVLAHDDHGDPIYADAGMTPRFHQLIESHVSRLMMADSGHEDVD